MTWVFAIVGLVAVLAIALAVVGREARRLDAVPPRPVFDMDEAVAWVAEHLPFEISAVLSHADVRNIIDWNLEYFRSKGASGNGSTPHFDAQVVVGGAETVDWVMTKAQQTGAAYTAAQVHAVLDAQMTYLEAIGAIGPEASTDPGAGPEPPTN